MARPLTIRLNPQTLSWAASFLCLEACGAGTLLYFGARGLTLAWIAAATAIFASFEHGIFAWLWAVFLARSEEEEPAERADIAITSPGTAADAPPAESESESADASVKVPPPPTYEEEYGKLLRRPTSNVIRAIEVVAALILAGLALLASQSLSGREAQLSEQQTKIVTLQADLKECQTKVAACEDPFSSGDKTATSRLEQELKLQREALDALKNTAKPCESCWGGSTALWGSAFVLLLIALAVGVVFMVRKRPETAAPLGTIGLAAAAIKEADHLSRIDVTSYRIAEVIFAFFLLILAGLALMALRKARDAEPQPAEAKKGDQKEGGKVESPLSLLFSALVLLWVILAICYRHEVTPTATQPPPPVSPEATVLDYDLLPSISGFVPGKVDQWTPHQGVDDVARKIAQDAHEQGAQSKDLLLLLGSADCTAVRRKGEMSNQKLARDRAGTLAAAMDRLGVFLPDHVRPKSLYQTENCLESKDLRAVFPVLIHARTPAGGKR